MQIKLQDSSTTRYFTEDKQETILATQQTLQDLKHGLELDMNEIREELTAKSFEGQGKQKTNEKSRFSPRRIKIRPSYLIRTSNWVIRAVQDEQNATNSYSDQVLNQNKQHIRSLNFKLRFRVKERNILSELLAIAEGSKRSNWC